LSPQNGCFQASAARFYENVLSHKAALKSTIAKINLFPSLSPAHFSVAYARRLFGPLQMVINFDDLYDEWIAKLRYSDNLF
jgi:hypothetical protein